MDLLLMIFWSSGPVAPKSLMSPYIFFLALFA